MRSGLRGDADRSLALELLAARGAGQPIEADRASAGKAAMAKRKAAGWADQPLIVHRPMTLRTPRSDGFGLEGGFPELEDSSPRGEIGRSQDPVDDEGRQEQQR